MRFSLPTCARRPPSTAATSRTARSSRTAPRSLATAKSSPARSCTTATVGSSLSAVTASTSFTRRSRGATRRLGLPCSLCGRALAALVTTVCASRPRRLSSSSSSRRSRRCAQTFRPSPSLAAPCWVSARRTLSSFTTGATSTALCVVSTLRPPPSTGQTRATRFASPARTPSTCCTLTARQPKPTSQTRARTTRTRPTVLTKPLRCCTRCLRLC
mmetsp:Transcript_3978/g.12945  ORF Transcript_3978/g.12945 Transcript_3978/m.12945 type:complete len:215 (-) Transcript_3978:1008-1652(-)